MTGLRHRVDEEEPCLRDRVEQAVERRPWTSGWTAAMSTLTLLAVVFDWSWQW